MKTKRKAPGYIPVFCSCVSCAVEIRTTVLAMHYHSCTQFLYPKKPREYGNCRCCNNVIIGYTPKEFCNSSCAGTYNNKLRPSGHPSRLKGNESRSFKAKYRAYQLPKQQKPTKPKFTIVNQCVICKSWFPGKNKTCSKKCLSLRMSEARKSIHRTGKNYTKRQFYISPSAGKVFLESSWELKLAMSLDDNNVSWSRPKYFNYTLNNKRRSYYPDFYLTKFDVYLDPKNTYQQGIDKNKIDAVLSEHDIKLYILDYHQCSWEYVQKLVVEEGIEPSSRSA